MRSACGRTDMSPGERVVVIPKEEFSPPSILSFDSQENPWSWMKSTVNSEIQYNENVTITNSLSDIKWPGSALVLDENMNILPFDHIIEANRLQVPKTLPKPTQIIDEAFIAFRLPMNCYGHFILDFIPKLKVAQKFKETIGEIPILIPEMIVRWQPPMLEAFWDSCIEDEYVVQCKSEQTILVKKAWIILPTNHAGVIPKWTIDYLRGGKKPNRKSRRLFVSREGLPRAWRRFTNHKEVVEAVSKYGFEEVHPQLLSISEQIKMFGEADAVFGMHGSGILNVLFGNPTLIEIMPKEWKSPYGYSIAGAAGLEYANMFVDGNEKSNHAIDVQKLDGLMKDIGM